MGVLRGERVLIQMQDLTGNWLTVNSTDDSNGQNIYARMKDASNSYRGHRVRAITERGSLIDVW